MEKQIMFFQTQIWIIKQKLTKKLTQKKKKMKKIPITRTEASPVVVGGEGLLVGWKVKGRWKRHQMVRTEASRDGVS